jgi:Chaperone of endosialidase
VGIGVTNPTSPLEIQTGTDSRVRIENDGGSNITAISSINNAKSGYQPLIVNGSYLGFDIAASEKMRIDSSGNVGIGTTSPGAKLEVTGTTDVTTSAAAGYGLRVRSPSGSATPAIIQFTNNPVNAQWATIASPSANILTFNDGGDVERMRLDSSGNLLVGVNIPNPGGATYNGQVAILSAGGTTKTGINIATTATTSKAIEFQYTAFGVLGSISTTTNATAYNTSSDYRLKENVVPITNGLATIKSLNPVTYDWINDKSKGEGFIAHELQSVIPAAVTGEKDAVDADGKPEYQGVDYSKIVVHLVAALQEAVAKIDALETRISTLETK